MTPTPTYDAQYLIEKFSKIPDAQWTAGVLVDMKGRKCAIGHCRDGQDAKALYVVLLVPARINDGEHPKYQQPTPKARILAALADAKMEGR